MGGRCLRLPYETRNPVALAKLLTRYARRLAGGGLEVCFEEEGLRVRRIICRANSIRVETRRVKVKDELSGLELEVSLPVIVIGEEEVPLRWEASRFTLRSNDLLTTKSCWET